MILFDTSVLIDIDDLVLPDGRACLSALSAAELRFGIELTSTQDLRQRRTRRFHRITRLLSTDWLAFDEAAASGYGHLAAIVATKRPAHARSKDTMIAGHAYALGARLATLNPKDFELIADEVEIVVPERLS
ncbi:hypothetical protein FM104_02540 [Microbacterium esteraromaticum]|uniref:PIN domain-containing protein n=1 Tax=Microbacterium esteraromaticum TaxID=57043 RepID=A0A1R4IKM4_9MICO|nr:PIN domain-containing protein [Microbacterium esteraromaticum]SJN20114.1 hypothetical protein FM104_02540 [Microbacterium esteraromaticum]